MQLWAVTTALGRLDLPFLSDTAVAILQLAGIVVIGGYLLFSVYHYVQMYGKKPEATATPEDKPSPELVAAFTAALLRPDDHGNEEKVTAAAARAVVIAKSMLINGEVAASPPPQPKTAAPRRLLRLSI